MTCRPLLALAIPLLVVVVPNASSQEPAPEHVRPNVVLFLADDLGYGGIGVHGAQDLRTPNIDRLAAGGVRMTDGYVSCPVCAPTRAGLLTGRYQQRFGLELNPGPEAAAAGDYGLPREQKTLAERLKAAGYATGMFGKWHLGYREGFRPSERGFDEFFGFLGGAHPYLPAKGAAPILRDREPVEEAGYLTEAIGREAAAFVDRHKAGPFFLYVPFNAVHTPMQATPALSESFKEIEDEKRRTHAAMLVAMDDAIGAVMERLREHQLLENTLVFFISDNGGPTRMTTSSNAPLRGFKGQVLEGGIRVPFIVQWTGTLAAGSTYTKPVISLDVVPTVLAACGVPLEDGAALDGVDLLPFLTGQAEGAPHATLHWRFGVQAALRAGDFKLLRQQEGPWSLYDLSKDVGEGQDLAAEMPEKVKQLAEVWESWNQQLVAPKWRRQAGQAPGRRSAAPTFQELDRNRDGKLTPDEVPTRRAFERADKDKDGVVTRAEYRAWRRGG